LLVFVALIFVVIGLVHWYLWKRLVRDPMVSPVKRRVGAVVAVVLALLIPVTLIGTRTGHVKWLAWPGYLWLALMFYLLVTLVPLEIPRLALLLLWRRRPRTSEVTSSTHAAGAGSSTKPALAGTAMPSEALGRVDSLQPASTGPAIATGVGRNGADAISPVSSPIDPGATSTPDPGVSSVTGAEANSATRPDRNGAGTDARRGNGTGADKRAGNGTGANKRGGNGTGADKRAGNGTGANKRGANGADADKRGANGTGTERPGANGTDAERGGAGADRPARNGPDGGDGVGRRLVLARGMAIFAGLTAAGITGYGVKTALGPPRLNRVQIPLAKLPRAMDGTRLALVSDIHIGPLSGTHHVGRIVDLINSVNADMVCVVGDLVDGSVAELGRFARPLADIVSRRGAYFVTGNHEYYSGFQPWVDEVARLGVRPLRNERVEIGGLDLAGVNDLGGEQFGDGPDFGRALGDRDPARPVVLMAHQPVVARQAAPFGVDLQVSGHTHGGQMAPFNLLVRLQQPVVSGLGKVDGVPVYVTNGAGFWGPPVRVGAPPQVTVIELRSV
jgi:predicted MPP superfamily phosphohydrolase